MRSQLAPLNLFSRLGFADLAFDDCGPSALPDAAEPKQRSALQGFV
jgi:hypothetical protein